MKIKTDFITNSSSTSFILIINGPLMKDEFLKAIGIEKDSPFNFLFEGFYSAVRSNMKSFDVDNSADAWQKSEYDDLPDSIKEKIRNAKAQNKNVYIGKLASEAEIEERYFCMDSFILENDSIYFNAVPNVW